MTRRVDLVVMSGLHGSSDAEGMVTGARMATTRDLVDKAIASGAFASIIVSTNDTGLGEAVSGLPRVKVELDPEEEPFHFGRRLSQLIARHGIERVVYLGGGSAPLLPASRLGEMAERVREADRLFLSNNFYSVDFCAFTPADTLGGVEPPASDNALGWLLSDQAGLPARELERTAATVFDVDTPADLMALSLHPGVPAHLRAYLAELELDTGRIEAASDAFVDRHAEVLISGRVGSPTLAYLEREALSRTRLFSEERGMRADGRLERGEVRSLLGMHMASVGMERFFGEVIPQLGQAAFLDDRVMWAASGVWPPASDRFSSDLGRPEAIADPFVRRFTEAALACPVPVVLGGHSLVAGGLCVLVESAWARSGKDVARRSEVG